MSRPRTASVEAKVRLTQLEKELKDVEEVLKLALTKIDEQDKFKERIEMGQRWFLGAMLAIGGAMAAAASLVSIIKDWPKFGSN